MAYKIFFPLLQTKAQHAGDAICRVEQKDKPKPNQPTWFGAEPKYKSEIEVTRALANGTFEGNSKEAYETARAWERYQKELNKPRFFPKKTAAKTNFGKYNHCLFPSGGH